MLIEVHNLTKVYNEKRGLLPTSFEVEKRELIAIVGHNGAGKSTLLKMLAGWLLPDSGEVLVDGINLKNRTALVRKVGFVPETPNLFDFFSVEYNFKLFARLFQIPLLQIVYSGPCRPPIPIRVAHLFRSMSPTDSGGMPPTFLDAVGTN